MFTNLYNVICYRLLLTCDCYVPFISKTCIFTFGIAKRNEMYYVLGHLSVCLSGKAFLHCYEPHCNTGES